MTDRIGLLLFRSFAGKYVVLRRGIKWTRLQWEGNTPELSDTFIRLVIWTVSVWRYICSRNIGIGSSSQDFLEDDNISLSTSVSEACLNTMQRWWTTGKWILQQEAEPGKEAWIWLMVFLKCFERYLQSELVESWAAE